MNFGTIITQGEKGKLVEIAHELEKHPFQIHTLTETKKKRDRTNWQLHSVVSQKTRIQNGKCPFY